MPGSGKSTVGRQLARRLGWAFVDADSEIERQLGQSIRSYFEQHGEPRFRDLESGVLGRLLIGESKVIATGGGAILRESNRHALRARAEVVYLRSTPEELMRRLRHDTHRPLLQVGDPMRKLRELYRARDPLYREIARFTIETGRPSVKMLAGMIQMQLELAGVIDADRGAGPADTDPREP
ncbi:MAG: shikimate kinase [Ideonella sp.]|nr:shikimate kinase [Ideonella sp.]